MRSLDYWAFANAWRSRHPLEKLALGGSLLGLALVLPAWPAGLMILLVATGLTVLGARVPLSAYLRVLVLPGGFLAVGVLALCLGIRAEAGPLRLVLLPELLEPAAWQALRSLAACSCLTFIAMTTPIPELLGVLPLPGVLVEVALTVYRLIHVAWERARALQRAQVSRLGYGNPGRAYRSLGFMLAALLVQSLARAQRLEWGLAARNGGQAYRARPVPYRLSAPFLGLVGILAAAIAWWGHR
ncbi:MAG: cobalt ECF transporter T component CbiQ [Candidatus Handelsmanbacteria bacterium]|nr:cobalt ECF transporter T component CbiQ [Candidatus Handelsmanbacteria bacterium]